MVSLCVGFFDSFILWSTLETSDKFFLSCSWRFHVKKKVEKLLNNKTEHVLALRAIFCNSDPMVAFHLWGIEKFRWILKIKDILEKFCSANHINRSTGKKSFFLMKIAIFFNFGAKILRRVHPHGSKKIPQPLWA